MNIEAYSEKVKFMFSYTLPHSNRVIVKNFLQDLFDRRDGQRPDKSLLYFAGGEWMIPKDKVHEMYKFIIKKYSELNH